MTVEDDGSGTKRDGHDDADSPVTELEDKPRTPSAGSVAQATVSTLQAMIREGRLKPGERIPPQRNLARELSVSRATLREALSILSTIGQIVPRPNGRGFVCAQPGDKATPSWRFAARYSLREVYQFRFIAESYAASLAAMCHTDEEIAALRACLDTLRKAAKDTDIPGHAKADFQFHRLIMRSSRNKLLVDMHDTFAKVVLESQRLPTERRGRLWVVVLEHERILEAIAMGDPEGASYYMRKHISMAGDRAGVPPSELP